MIERKNNSYLLGRPICTPLVFIFFFSYFVNINYAVVSKIFVYIFCSNYAMRIFTLKKLWHKQLNLMVKEFRINVLAYRITNAVHCARSELFFMRSVYHSHQIIIVPKTASFVRYMLLSSKKECNPICCG